MQNISETKKTFSALHGAILIFIGAMSFCVAGYWGLMLKDVVPVFIEATNKSEISWLVVAVWILLGAYASAVWVCGCLATRAHAILYDRWFK